LLIFEAILLQENIKVKSVEKIKPFMIGYYIYEDILKGIIIYNET